MGWVDFNLEDLLSCLASQPVLPNSCLNIIGQMVETENQNPSHPNPGPQPPVSPCILQIAYRTAICPRENLSYNQFSLYCCPISSFCYIHNVEVCPRENLSYIQFSLYRCPITSCPISDPQCSVVSFKSFNHNCCDDLKHPVVTRIQPQIEWTSHGSGGVQRLVSRTRDSNFSVWLIICKSAVSNHHYEVLSKAIR